MKVIGIGDIHGRPIWKEIILTELDADMFVFIGDYFDSRNGGYSAARQIANFKEILEFKRTHMDTVTLLIGNHDFHYMKGVNEVYSGHQAGYHFDIQEVIHEALREGLLQMCYQHDKYFFSHAGVTMTWCFNCDIDTDNLVESINDRFKYKPNDFKFTSGIFENKTGDEVTQSPIWVRPYSLESDMVEGIVCVVGHTVVYQLLITPKLICIDTLGKSEQYLVLLDGEPKIGEVKR